MLSLNSEQEGDIIAVRLCAQFPGWEIYAKDGRLVMELSENESQYDMPV